MSIANRGHQNKRPQCNLLSRGTVYHDVLSKHFAAARLMIAEKVCAYGMLDRVEHGQRQL